MVNTNLSFYPVDTLFFRDGTPFTMGEDVYTESLKMPTPSVLYGAVSTLILSTLKEKNKLSIEENIKILLSLDLRITKNVVRSSGEFGMCYLPMPKDLILPKDVEDAIFLEKKILPNKTTILCSSDNKKVESGILMMDISTFNNYYLNCSDNSFNIANFESDFKREIKIGIGRDSSTKQTQDGLLYRISQIRNGNFKLTDIHLGFLIGISLNDDILNNIVVGQLGGEKKITTIHQNEDDFQVEMPDLEGLDSFKIYLATPAIFNSGAIPNKLFAKYDLELITAALDKPINIGGWNMKEQCPKPMLQAVPAGSVYYVKAKKGVEAAQKAAKAIHNQAISDNIEHQNQGFGIAYIGKIQFINI